MIGLTGVQVIESDVLLRDVLHKRERKWAHRKMWKRFQRFNITTERVPYMIQANGVIYAHPDIVQRLKNLPAAELKNFL